MIEVSENAIREIAEACHEVIRAYCDFATPEAPFLSWEEAPAWQRKSSIAQAKIHLENPDMGPEASHEAWMKEKRDDGWVLGPDKDAEKKEHPCMVPFEKLPPEQQAKDVLFREVVRAMAAKLGVATPAKVVEFSHDLRYPQPPEEEG